MVRLEKTYPVGQPVTIIPEDNPGHHLVPGSVGVVEDNSDVHNGGVYVVRGTGTHGHPIRQYLAPSQVAATRKEVATV